MKNYIVKMIALLMVITTVALSGCSLQYRQQRMHRSTPDRYNNSRDQNNDHSNNTRDRYYNNHDNTNDRQYNAPHRY